MTFDFAARRRSFGVRALTISALVLAAASRAASAQTDYYNLDAGRPLRVEDARVIERHALELQLAPFRVRGARGEGTLLSLEPELAWGALPRTQFEIGFPVEQHRFGARHSTGLAGIHLAALYALNIESLTLPAFALGARAQLPIGSRAPASPYATVTGVATRTFPGVRVHVNASYTAGPSRGNLSDESDAISETSRWEGGVGVDHPFPLRSMLVGVELVARKPIVTSLGTEWSAAGGIRQQVSPRIAVDIGAGRTFVRGGEWFVTFGSAYAFGMLARVGGRP